MSKHAACLLILLSALAGCQGQPTTGPITSGTQFTVEGRAGHPYLYFDLQGILWRVSVDGGEATALTDARDDIRHPRLSPDGRQLVFQTFATGSWQIGIMNIDGSGYRRLTDGDADHRDPDWAQAGQAVLYSTDAPGYYTLRLHHLEKPPEPEAALPGFESAAPSINEAGRSYLQTGKGRTRILWQPSARPDAGEVEVAAGRAGELHAPRVSPDGRRIAFVQAAERNGFPGVARNQLILYDIAGGGREILSPEGADVFTTAPAWLDEDTLVYTADGGILRIDLATGTTTAVPFSVALPVRRTGFRPATPIAFAEDEQQLLGIVDPQPLPDGRIVFTGLGDLLLVERDGRTRALTDDAWVERDVSLSPDGERLAYIADRDGSMQIWLHDLGTGEVRRVTDKSTGPRYPTFSPDGSALAYLQVGPIGTQDYTLQVLDLNTGATRRLRQAPNLWPGRIAWSADGSHITVAELHRTSKRFGYGRNRLVRVSLTDDSTTLLELPDALTPDSGPVAAPDHRTLALIIDGALWTLPVDADGSLAAPPQRLVDDLVESPAFSPDGTEIIALTARGLERIRLSNQRRSLQNPRLQWVPANPGDKYIVHAGRVFTGDGDTYLEDMDIVMDGARIVAVQPHQPHPADFRVIDASEQTVIPGLVDHHVHFQPHQGEWVGRAWLAFGVTTIVEPGGLPYESREHLESWATDRRPGPRLVYAGPQLDGSRRTFYFASHITSEERLRRELERGEQLGYGFLKTYTRLSPTLQQQAVELGHELGLPVTAHAAFRNLGFGGDRIEHLRGSSRLTYSAKQSALLNSYADMQRLVIDTGATVTPTIIVAGGFVDYLERFPGLADNPQYVALYSPAARRATASLSLLAKRRMPLIRSGLDNARASIRNFHDNGALIVAGTDSPIFPYGLALVVELANYVDAGLTPADALRTATVNAAAALGAGKEIGRIAPGYLADLVIIDGDPLANVQDLLSVRGVMKNGNYRSLAELTGPQ